MRMKVLHATCNVQRHAQHSILQAQASTQPGGAIATPAEGALSVNTRVVLTGTVSKVSRGCVDTRCVDRDSVQDIQVALGMQIAIYMPYQAATACFMLYGLPPVSSQIQSRLAGTLGPAVRVVGAFRCERLMTGERNSEVVVGGGGEGCSRAGWS